MRIVISGGTGFIGRSLARDLAERGDEVVILTRGSSPFMPVVRPSCCRGNPKVELVRWTPEASGDWARVIDGVDAVVHLAGAGIADERWTDERMQVLRSSRIRGCELLARAIARCSKKPRCFVSGSAVGYYGLKAGDHVLTESDPPGDDFLATLVRDWESAAAEAREAGVRVCHPRFGMVLGRRGGVFAKLLPMYRAFMGGPLGDGTQYVPWVHVADVVAAIEHAIECEELSGPFNMTAPEPVTMNEFAARLGEALERPASIRVPAMAIKLALGNAAAEAFLAGQRAIPKKLGDSGFAFLFPELVSALADLVTQPARVML